MTKHAERRAERADPRGRLRQGFVHQVYRELDELAALLREGGEEEREHVHGALERMADRADSLGLVPVGDSARAVALQVRMGSSASVLGGVTRALGHGDRPRLFPPIALVTGGRRDLLGKLEQVSSERLHLVEAVEDLRDEVWFEDMQAALCPVKPRRALRALAHRAPGRTWAWGPTHDVGKRMSALADGAAGYFGLPLDLPSVLQRIRFDTWRRLSSAPRVQLVTSADVLGDAIESALTRARLAVVRAGTAEEALAGVVQSYPELVLLTGQLDAGDLAAVVGTLRADEAAGAVPIVLLGDEREHHLEPGLVDGSLPHDLSPTSVARAVRRRLDRPSGWVPYRDPLTGLPNRPAVLAGLDDEFARAHRTRAPVAVALVELDHLPADGSDADRALRRVAEVLRGRTRAYDLVGRLGGGAFLVGLPGCTAPSAERRLQEIHKAVERRVQRDLVLAGLTFSAGVADSVLGLDTVLARADAALGAARLGGPRAVGRDG